MTITFADYRAETLKDAETLKSQMSKLPAHVADVVYAAAVAECNVIADEYEAAGFVTDEMNNASTRFARVRNAAITAGRKVM